MGPAVKEVSKRINPFYLRRTKERGPTPPTTHRRRGLWVQESRRRSGEGKGEGRTRTRRRVTGRGALLHSQYPSHPPRRESGDASFGVGAVCYSVKDTNFYRVRVARARALARSSINESERSHTTPKTEQITHRNFLRLSVDS